MSQLSFKNENLTVDWIIDPIGNTDKSSFARCYISKKSIKKI